MPRAASAGLSRLCVGLCRGPRRWMLAVCVLLVPIAPAVGAQPGGDGIDWVTIGAPGNAPWAGDGTPGDRAVGRGGVNYEYNIGRFEVTSAQWVEFFNAAFDRPAGDRLPHLIPPNFWGGVPTSPTTPGGLRWTTTPQSAMRPTGNISWRMAAMYCNWLHYGRGTDRAAFLNGAYDVSTFGATVAGRFTDQLTHHPGARYWVPTWDEWLKAAHYDQNKLNPDGTRGGWWRYSNGSDIAFVPGPPGAIVNGQPATANFGWDSFDFPGQSPFAVPLGAYANVTSPFGLYDVAGATGEWTEEALYPIPGELFPNDRLFDGTWWIDGFPNSDRLGIAGGSEIPNYSGFELGFRIATSVPAPGACSLVAGLFLLSTFGRRRRHAPCVVHHRRCGSVPVRSWTDPVHD